MVRPPESRERVEYPHRVFVHLSRALARISLGLQDCLFLENLAARPDWGHAKDFVRMQWMMLQQDLDSARRDKLCADAGFSVCAYRE